MRVVIGAASGAAPERLRPAQEEAAAAPANVLPPLQAAMLNAVQQMMANTEDVGETFPEEARRIHYGEAEAAASAAAQPEDAQALREEGIEVHVSGAGAARCTQGPVQ